MSPEAIQNHQYSTKSDVFSFGVVVWEIISNEEPYGSTSAVEVAISVTTQDLRPSIPKEANPQLANIMRGEWKFGYGDEIGLTVSPRSLLGEKSARST